MSTIKAINIQHPSSPNTNIVMDANGNMTVAGTVSGGTQTSGMRNRIINGDMKVWQRGTSFTNPSWPVSTAYTADRWFVSRNYSTANCSATQQTTSVTGLGKYALRIQRTAGDVNTSGNFYIIQHIENKNMMDLPGQTVTFSGWVKFGANFSGSSLQASLYSGTGTDENFYNGYTGQTSVCTTSLSANTSYVKFSITGTVPSNSNELAVFFGYTPTGTAGANDWFEITDIQVEAGSIATAFERRPIALETALCEYYYKKLIVLPGGGSGYGALSYYGGTSAVIYHGHFTMRTSPNTSYLNNAAVQYYSYAGVWTASTASINRIGSGPYFVSSWFTSDGDGRGKLMRKNDANDLILVLDAEL